MSMHCYVYVPVIHSRDTCCSKGFSLHDIYIYIYIYESKSELL